MKVNVGCGAVLVAAKKVIGVDWATRAFTFGDFFGLLTTNPYPWMET